jgi:hypothetical protein
MRSRHLSALRIAEQHGQTVGHHDGARQTGLEGVGAIRALAVHCMGRQLQHVKAVYLVEKHGARAKSGLQTQAIAVHRARIIPHVQPQIQTGIGTQRRAPIPAGAQGTNVGRRGPVGY